MGGKPGTPGYYANLLGMSILVLRRLLREAEAKDGPDSRRAKALRRVVEYRDYEANQKRQETIRERAKQKKRRKRNRWATVRRERRR